MNRRRRAAIAAAFAGAFIVGLTGTGFRDAPVAASEPSAVSAAQVHETTPERRSEAAQRASRGAQARPCILHRESRGTYHLPPNGAGASGAYQFMPVAWDATARRAGRDDLVGVSPWRASKRDQDAMYRAAWEHGNGRFYWSARWGAPYACFPGDVRPMRSGS